MREEKRVLRESELDEVWEQIHQHAGINTSWAKLNGNWLDLKENILI